MRLKKILIFEGEIKMKTITLILLLAVLALPAYSQNITNTLGTGGIFTVKDASNNYLTVSQSDGLLSLNNNLSLLNTTGSSIGVITKGAYSFIHNFAPAGADGFNTFVGINSGNFSMSGTTLYSSENTGIGCNSLQSLVTGSCNTAVGYVALLSNTTGSYNTAVGTYSLDSNMTGNWNTAVGGGSLHFNTTGSYNTAVGAGSLSQNKDGQGNTAMGHSALALNTTGQNNTAVGFWAGHDLTTGSNNTVIGYMAEPSAASVSNQITLGNSFITSLRCAVTTITALSDARDKKNIQDLSLGIDFLMKIKPRLFNWDKREWYKDSKSDGSRMQKTLTAGFIAQELDEVQTKENAEWLNLVLKDDPEKLEATPGNLLPVMVKAIQELKAENNELKDKIEKFERMQNVLVSEIEKLKSKDVEVTQAKNDN
jgi:hypothetical protein